MIPMRRYFVAFLVSPISGPLALRGFECVRGGERLLGLLYLAAVPLIWADMVGFVGRGF